MKYKVLLVGNKEVIIDQLAKEKLEQVVREGSERFVEISGEYVKTSAIKAILKVGEQQTNEYQNQHGEDMKVWNRECSAMAKLSVEEKTEKEMKVRVMPGWKMSGQNENDVLLSDAYGAISNFFEENPMYPRCPMKVWFPILSQKFSKSGNISRWFEMIARNDDAIDGWVKYMRMKA